VLQLFTIKPSILGYNVVPVNMTWLSKTHWANNKTSLHKAVL